MQDTLNNIEELKSQGKIIITTNGSFDILHSAHINILERAKSQGNILVVLLNSDNSIKRNKGEKRPIVNQIERIKMLNSLKCVDFVIPFEEDTPIEVLKKIKPNKHVKGGSVIPSRIEEEKNLLESWGGEFISLPLEEGLSTTNIIEDILKKYN